MKLYFQMPIAMVSLILLSGCQKVDSITAPNPPLSEETRPSELAILIWDEYFSPDVIGRFEAETGTTVRQVNFENLGQMMGLIGSHPGEYDMLVTDDVSIAELIETKQLARIDRGRIPNFRHLDPRYLDQPSDPGNRFSVPYVWGTTLIAYRKDHIANPRKSWDLLWDETLKGRVAMMDERADVFAAGLLRSGFSLNSQELPELEQATKALIEQAEKIEPVYADWSGIRDLFLAGKISAAILYSCDAAALAAEDDNIGYFIPEEGAPLWLDSFAVFREAKNKDAALAFIDFMSQPQVAAENAAMVWYKPPLRGTERWLPEDLAADESLNPPEPVLERCAFHATATSERENTVNQGMKQILDRIRATSQLAEAGE